MDYTYILTQISSNQLDILSKMDMLQKGFDTILLLFAIFFIYLFLRNLLKRQVVLVKNKFLFTFLFIVCIFLIPSFCSASTITFSDGGKDYVVENDKLFENYVVARIYDTGYDIFTFSNTSFYFKAKDNPQSYNPDNKSFACAFSEDCFVTWVKVDRKSGNISSILYDNKFFASGASFAGSFGGDVAYSTFDIYDYDGNIFFENSEKAKFNLTVEPCEETKNVPVRVYSNYFNIDRENSSGVKVSKYRLEMKEEFDDDWRISGYEHQENEKGEYVKERFVFDIYKNGLYYFRFWDKDKKEYVNYQEISIDNIVYTQDTIDNYVDGKFDPTPFLRL